MNGKCAPVVEHGVAAPLGVSQEAAPETAAGPAAGTEGKVTWAALPLLEGQQGPAGRTAH